MTVFERFPEIAQANVRLAPFTRLKVGGPAEFLLQPRSTAELTEVLAFCTAKQIPARVLGSGVNLIIRDDVLPGVTLRLVAPVFTDISVNGGRVRAGCGAKLSALVFATAKNNLAGFETLVGIAATVGGALRCNAGDRSGDMGSFVRRVEVLDEGGEANIRERDELRFGEHSSNLDDAILLAAEFQLHPDKPDAIVKRMRKAWILRQASQPYPHESSARAFLNPAGQSARDLLEKAGLARTRVGGAEVSERNANFIVTHAGATARDVIELMTQMKQRVLQSIGVELQPELVVW